VHYWIQDVPGIRVREAHIGESSVFKRIWPRRWRRRSPPRGERFLDWDRTAPTLSPFVGVLLLLTTGSVADVDEGSRFECRWRL